jgi:hypothetical protein
MEVEDKDFWRGRTVNILILFNDERLVYTARILHMGYYHVCFMDKFKRIYSYNLQNVIEIEELKHGEKKDFWDEEIKEENGGEKNGIV